MLTGGFESNEQNFQVHAEVNWEVVEPFEGQGRRCGIGDILKTMKATEVPTVEVLNVMNHSVIEWSPSIFVPVSKIG